MDRTWRRRAVPALGLLVMLGAAWPLQAQESTAPVASDVRREVEEALAAIRDYSIEQKDAAVAKGQELMGQLDQQMAEAQAEADQATGEVQSHWQATLAQLEELKVEAGKQLSDLSASSAEMWERVKQGFADTAATLDRQLRDLMDSKS